MEPLFDLNLKLKIEISISKKSQKMLQKVQKKKEINPKLVGISPEKIEYMCSSTQLFHQVK